MIALKTANRQNRAKRVKKPADIILTALVVISAIFTFAVLIFIILYILSKGIPYIKPSLFALKYTTENVSLLPALITTLEAIAISLLVSVPIGIFSAVYLIEYSKKGNKLVKIIRVTTEALSGIPSIIYGLFGMLFFLEYLKLGYSILSGCLTLSIMILPLIIRTTEESLKSVPDSYRDASFGLGAGRFRTVFKIILPAAAPGILAGVILATGRIIGETAALLCTAGSIPQVPGNLLASGRTLAVHLYALSSESLYTGQAYATAVVLLVLVIGINALSAFIAKKVAKV